MAKTPVTVLGLGQMGAALVPPLLNAGHDVSVWNRSPEKAQPLVAAGARYFAELCDALAAGQLIIVCVSDYSASDQLLHGDPVAALLKGKTLVQFTTGTSTEARQSAAWAEDSGITYLDGAIMDYPAKIGGADTMLLLSGDQAAFDRNADTLRLLGGRLTYVGEDPATANVMDGGLLTVYYGCALSFMQSAAMVMAEGIAVERLHDALLHFTPVLTSTFGRCASAIGQNDYTGAEASIAVHAAGVKSLQSRASQRGVDNRLLSLFVDYLAEAQRSGDSANELPAVFKVFQAHSKLAAVAE